MATYVLEIDGAPIANNIRRSFRSAVEGAKLDATEITPHTLRHTAASWMVQAGISLKEVADFLGHSDTRMVEKHYSHLSPDYLKRAILVLDMGEEHSTLTPQEHPINDNGLGQDALTHCFRLVEPGGIEPPTSTMPLAVI